MAWLGWFDWASLVTAFKRIREWKWGTVITKNP